MHTSLATRPWFPGVRKGAGHQISAEALLLRPRSRGVVGLRSADPTDPPFIRLNLLDNDEDMRRMRDMARLIRRVFATEAVAPLVTRELVPGPQVQSDNDLDDFIRAAASTGMHPVGTVAMDSGGDAVLDAELRVRAGPGPPRRPRLGWWPAWWPAWRAGAVNFPLKILRRNADRRMTKWWIARVTPKVRALTSSICGQCRLGSSGRIVAMT